MKIKEILTSWWLESSVIAGIGVGLLFVGWTLASGLALGWSAHKTIDYIISKK
jgi:hypothetical protein